MEATWRTKHTSIKESQFVTQTESQRTNKGADLQRKRQTHDWESQEALTATQCVTRKRNIFHRCNSQEHSFSVQSSAIILGGFYSVQILQPSRQSSSLIPPTATLKPITSFLTQPCNPATLFSLLTPHSGKGQVFSLCILCSFLSSIDLQRFSALFYNFPTTTCRGLS